VRGQTTTWAHHKASQLTFKMVSVIGLSKAMARLVDQQYDNGRFILWSIGQCRF
jgi:hypothetical protein